MLSALGCAIPAVESPTFVTLRTDNSILSSGDFHFLFAFVSGLKAFFICFESNYIKYDLGISFSLIDFEDFVFLLAIVTWYDIPVKV